MASKEEMDEFLALLAKRGELEDERRALMDREGLYEFFYVYVLELDNGEFCVGHTDTPLAKFTETEGVDPKGHDFRVKMVQPFNTLESTRYNEGRLQTALALSPANIAAMVHDFERFNREMRADRNDSAAELGTQRPSVFKFILKTFAGWLIWGVVLFFVLGMSHLLVEIHWVFVPFRIFAFLLIVLWATFGLWGIVREYRMLRKLTKEERAAYIHRESVR